MPGNQATVNRMFMELLKARRLRIAVLEHTRAKLTVKEFQITSTSASCQDIYKFNNVQNC